MEGHRKSSNTIVKEWLQTNILAIGLLIIVVVGFSVTAYLTIKNEYVPTTKEVVIGKNSEIYVVITKDKEIMAPITTTFLERAKSIVIVEIYFVNENIDASSFRKVVLSTNSSSILTVKNENLLPAMENLAVYNGTVEIGHPLVVNNITEAYYVDILYRPNNQVYGDLSQLRVPIEWTVRTLDFGKPSYFWIIFAGVLLSRIFSYSPNPRNFSLKQLDTRDVLWAPFSAVITLLIFTSFREQVVLTEDIITNLALAFSFGFGFDKILEVWQKSPRSTKDTKDKSSQQTSS
jgi:hypothetical protein